MADRTAMHHGNVALPPMAFGPVPRDELAALTTARLSHAALGDIPGLEAPSPPASTLMVGGQSLCLRTTAGPADAPHTWYVHGLEGMSQNWDRLAAALSPYSAGFAVDLPGSGLSEPPRGRYSVASEADLLARLIQRRSFAPVHLVGNSRGGVVATMVAARHPALVRTLTLISPAVPDFRMTSDRGANPRLGLVMMPGIGRSVERMLASVTSTERAAALAASCFGEPEAISEEELAVAAGVYQRRSALPWARRDTVMALRSLIIAQALPGRWSFRAAAGRVRVPVLVVWGTRDRLVDVRLASATASRFADARLLILERTGHVAQMERPDVTARAVKALWEDAATQADLPARHSR